MFLFTATIKELGIHEFDAKPSVLPENVSCESFLKKKAILDSINSKVVDKLSNIKLFSDSGQSNQNTDEVYEYAREVLTLSLLHEDYNDDIREGDGERVILVWKFLPLIFKASNK